MTTMRLEAMKAEFVREILNEQDETLLKKVMAFFTEKKKEKLSSPCRYTLEELSERLAKSEEDIKAGRTIPSAEVFKPYEKWL